MAIGAGMLSIVMLFAPGASSVRAQEQGQIGLAMGYPTGAAVVWHVTDAIAVRPEVNFSGSHYETSPSTAFTSAGESDSTTIGVGVSGLIYIGKWDALRTYVSPQYHYFRSSTTTEISYPFDPTVLAALTGPGSSPLLGTIPSLTLTIPPTRTENTSSTMTVTGSFGAQYALHKRFSAFGEVGFGYSWLSTSSTSRTSSVFGNLITPDEEPRSRNWGTRSAVGIIFYF